MRRTLCAALAALLLASDTLCAAEISRVTGAWGLSFGSSWEDAHRIMTEENKAALLWEFIPKEGAREAVYKVDFFGRDGIMRLSFSSAGLYLEQFAFALSDLFSKNESELTDDEKTEKLRIEVRGGNFRQLMGMLREKYGAPDQTYKNEENRITGCLWNVGRQVISLYENKSVTGHNTALTYEDVSRRK
ncbi:MAG: hypothetical protein SOZ52_04130 [Pyramidobacter sp.]|nr:hypothetical protein [Pyramidobacter sp.]